MNLARPQSAITGIMVVVVVSIIVVTVGVGSFVALSQPKNANSTVSSTVVPEMSTSSATSSSSTITPSSSSRSSPTSTTSSQPTPRSTTSQSPSSSITSSTSSQMMESASNTSFVSSILSTITSETTSSCSTSLNYNGSGLTNVLTSTFPPYLVKDLVGNFSHMAVRFSTSSSVNASSLGNASIKSNELILGSYSSLGTNVINGTDLTLVNFTDDIGANASAAGKVSTWVNETGTIYFNPTWNATLITIMGFNITGSLAAQIGGELLIFFELPFVYTTLETSLMGTNYEALHEINQSTDTFGNVTMNVTNYNFTSSSANSTMFSTTTSSTKSGCPGFNVSQVNTTGYGTLQMGKLPNSNTTILTMLSYYSSSPGLLTSSGTFQIESLMLAPPTTSTSTQSSSTTTGTTTMTTI
jgi:hypothetical protein